MYDDPALDGYDYDAEYIAYEQSKQLEGFTSDDGKHKVSWELSEIVPGLEYETWWCLSHDRLYYGGCNKVDKPYGR